MKIKDKIVQSAEELFMQYGIRSVTMDDVARQSSMSKKTIYQYFENKDNLVMEVAVNHIKKEKNEFLEVENEALDAVHELILVSQRLRKYVFRMNPSLLFDLQKYHGAAWERYLSFKHDVIRGYMKQNLERGRVEGFFREEIDTEVLSIFRVEQVQMVFNLKVFPHDKFDFPTVQMQLLDHFINGLLTDEGRKKYEEYTQLETQLHTNL
ncbi:MAG: TetR/AcrR family transcriptional regulator [Bacteroidota bacterium]